MRIAIERIVRKVARRRSLVKRPLFSSWSLPDKLIKKINRN